MAQTDTSANRKGEIMRFVTDALRDKYDAMKVPNESVRPKVVRIGNTVIVRFAEPTGEQTSVCLAVTVET